MNMFVRGSIIGKHKLFSCGLRRETKHAFYLRKGAIFCPLWSLKIEKCFFFWLLLNPTHCLSPVILYVCVYVCALLNCAPENETKKLLSWEDQPHNSDCLWPNKVNLHHHFWFSSYFLTHKMADVGDLRSSSDVRKKCFQVEATMN